MSVLDKAKEHYKSSLAGDMKTIYVEEWDETIYFKPSANFAQQSKVMELHAKGKLTEALIETCVVRCLTADGKRMFRQGDREILMREVDPEVIVRIVSIINGNDDAFTDADLGN